MEFGNILKQLRENNNLTREELSHKLNITYSALAKYENNDRFPDRKILTEIADFFDVSIDYLLGRNTRKQTINTNELIINLDNLSDDGINQIKEYIELIKLKENNDKGKGSSALENVN